MPAPSAPSNLTPSGALHREIGWHSFLPKGLVLLTLAALMLWGVAQILRYYPDNFFPRFADEGIYAGDVRRPTQIFASYNENIVRYAPAKLGYGLLAAGSSALLGENGPMYLSTIMWGVVVVTTAAATLWWFGSVAAVITMAFLLYSPVFGKYLAEAGPTTTAAFAFLLLWIASGWQRAWLTGICVGLAALVDFKWAIPAGIAFASIVFVERRADGWRRVVRDVMTGIATALAVIALAFWLHPPYWDFLREYIFPHSRLVRFQPSPVAIYHLWLFGALPAVAVAALAYTWPTARSSLPICKSTAKDSLVRVAILLVVPALFYSVFGVHKALRFFAVVFPLLSVCVGVGLGALLLIAWQGVARLRHLLQVPASALIALVAACLVHGGSDGPAYHMTLASGFDTAIREMNARGLTGASISSYNWPVITYAWPAPTARAPFAMWGPLDTDRWLMLAPALDRPTVDLRVHLGGFEIDADSLWVHNTKIYHGKTDSLFSVPCTFYGSDYFLSELVYDGIGVFRRWRRQAAENGIMLTVRQFRGEPFRYERLPLPER